MHIFCKIIPLFALFSDKGFYLGNISIKYLPKLPASYYLSNCLLVSLGNLGWFLQVLQIFVLFVNLFFDYFEIFKKD